MVGGERVCGGTNAGVRGRVVGGGRAQGAGSKPRGRMPVADVGWVGRIRSRAVVVIRPMLAALEAYEDDDEPPSPPKHACTARRAVLAILGAATATLIILLQSVNAIKVAFTPLPPPPASEYAFLYSTAGQKLLSELLSLRSEPPAMLQRAHDLLTSNTDFRRACPTHSPPRRLLSQT